MQIEEAAALFAEASRLEPNNPAFLARWVPRAAAAAPAASVRALS